MQCFYFAAFLFQSFWEVDNKRYFVVTLFGTLWVPSPPLAGSDWRAVFPTWFGRSRRIFPSWSPPSLALSWACNPIYPIQFFSIPVAFFTEVSNYLQVCIQSPFCFTSIARQHGRPKLQTPQNYTIQAIQEFLFPPWAGGLLSEMASFDSKWWDSSSSLATLCRSKWDGLQRCHLMTSRAGTC